MKYCIWIILLQGLILAAVSVETIRVENKLDKEAQKWFELYLDCRKQLPLELRK